MTNGSTSVRAFLAMNLTPAVHDALVTLKRDFAERFPKVRWVRDEGLHATIKFLGHVPAPLIEQIRDALRPVVGHFAPFSVCTRGLGAFPSPARPRVVWVGLSAENLPRVAEAVESTLEPLGFARERRPFRCHITLGRIDAPQAWARLADALKSHASDDFGSCRIEELVAYRSQLQRGGAVYTRMWAIELGGGDQHGTAPHMMKD
jgi:2'-5' RNA ligase